MPTVDRCTPPITGYIVNVIISFNGISQSSKIFPVNTTSVLLSDYFSNYLMGSKAAEYDVYVVAINNIYDYIPDFSVHSK